MSDFYGVDSARALFQAATKNNGTPYQLSYSNKSTSTAISVDGNYFASQLVDQINQSQGVDTDPKTFTIDEFARFVSGDEFKTFDAITDKAEKALVESTFNEISGNKAKATVGDLALYIRGRDTADGTTDGQAVLNFLI